MKVAICGLGRAGKIHFNNLFENKDLELKYIFDLRVEQIKNTIGNKFIITDDINLILNDKEVEIVFICTPTFLHYELIKLCLMNKKHILCEKPLSNNKDEIIECYNMADKYNLKLLCALNRRFDPNIIKLRQNIIENKIGRIHQINTISRDYPYPKLDYLKISSGIFHDCGVHDIDFINWILNDRPKYVYATGNIIKDINENDGNLDNAVIILEYPNGILVNINLSRISNNYDQRIEIFGENGVLISENPYGCVSNFRPNPISFPQRYQESYKNEVKHLVYCIKNNENLIITKKDCLNSLAITENCELSYIEMKKKSINYYN